MSYEMVALIEDILECDRAIVSGADPYTIRCYFGSDRLYILHDLSENKTIFAGLLGPIDDDSLEIEWL